MGKVLYFASAIVKHVVVMQMDTVRYIAKTVGLVVNAFQFAQGTRNGPDLEELEHGIQNMNLEWRNR